MCIPKLHVSKAKYETSKLKKNHENNGEAVRLKAYIDVARGSTQIDNKPGMVTETLKPNIDDVAHKLSPNDHIKPNKQIGEKAQVPITRVRAPIIKASNTPFSREQIKEIFQYYDSNNDGFLNLREVTKAFAFLGSIVPLYKAYHGMVYADTNKDGLISEDELEKLTDYAYKFIKKR